MGISKFQKKLICKKNSAPVLLTAHAGWTSLAQVVQIERSWESGRRRTHWFVYLQHCAGKVSMDFLLVRSVFQVPLLHSFWMFFMLILEASTCSRKIVAAEIKGEYVKLTAAR